MSSSSESRRGDRILLFDVDGTLTKPRLKITDEMKQFLADVRKRCFIGMVGGSDLVKQKEQLGEDVLGMFDYVFPQNGLVAYRQGQLIDQQSLRSRYTEAELQPFINFVLRYVADLDIPVKRGCFLEFRDGMLNVSPIGRNCNQAERDAFEKFDHEHRVREKFVGELKHHFAHLGFHYSIGGQISFDVFPHGWDKTFCLQYVKRDGFSDIHFFGDKTMPGGNDYEIYVSDETVGHSVDSPDTTRRLVEEVLSSP